MKRVLSVPLEPEIVITPDDIVLAQVTWRQRLNNYVERDLLDAVAVSES